EAKAETPAAPTPPTTPDAPPPPAPPPPPPPHPSQPPSSIVEQVDATVCFAPGAATLDAKGVEQAKALAKLVADRMHRNPQVLRVAVDGRVGPDENAKDPAKLSAARAQVVLARLAKGGVPKGKLVARGRGLSASYYASPPFNREEHTPCVDVIAFVSP
ncbi:MAG TPA: OmpA family protein, partial [Labilithrix sp.]